MATIEDTILVIEQIEQLAAKTVVSAANESAEQARDFAINNAIHLNLPSGQIRSSIRFITRATESNTSALIRSQKKFVSLGRFPHTAVKGGVRVSRARGSSSFLEGAFLLPTSSGVKVIAIPKDKIKQNRSISRVKIKGGRSRFQVLSGPTPNQLFFRDGPIAGRESVAQQSRRFLRLVNEKF